MKLIVGLGNPGEEYMHNRHNVGFMFLDYLAANHPCPSLQQKEGNNNLTSLSSPPYQGGVSEGQGGLFKHDKYLHSEILKINDNLIFAKPSIFMNLSGQAVATYVTRYKLHVTNDLIVVHDDLDIPLGKFKIQNGNGPLMHNGIDSIEEHLHTKDFWRVRIGVDNRTPEKRIPGETYVLQNFNAEEIEIVQNVFLKIFQHPVWIDKILNIK